jgi:hypothetical protein
VTATLDPRCRQLVLEAAEWRLLSLLFDYPHGAWRAQVAALAAEIEDAALRSCAQLALEQADAGLYHSTFGPGGPAAPREVSHHDALENAAVTAEAAARFCQDHLSRIAEPLAAHLADSGLGYLADAGEALVKRAGPVPQESSAPTRILPVWNDDSTFSCCDFPDSEEKAPTPLGEGDGS